MLNTAEEKLGWIFTAFDADGGGTIDVEEIRFNYVIFCMFLLLFSVYVAYQGHSGRPVQTRRSRGRRRPSLCVHHGCQVDVHL